jgi:alkylation response protein AidB-like acyl-CoA dehydrogenase
MDQPGVEVRPIVQLTGTAEFNEVFFDGARTDRELVVGEPGDGWRVAMGTLAFERGVATIGQQVGFRRELAAVEAMAGDDPVLREKLTRARIELEVMRAHTMRTLGTAEPGTAAAPMLDPASRSSVAKLLWANWHRRLGELAMEVRGAAGMVADPELDRWQRLYLFSRADTIYGGSNEIQRNIIAHRVLGLPR